MSAVQVSTRPSKKADQTGLMQGEQGRGRTEIGQGKREHRPRINRTSRAGARTVQGQGKAKQDGGPDRVNGQQESRRYSDRDRQAGARTVQGQDQMRCWEDRAGTGPDEMLGGPCRDRTKRDIGRTDGAGTGPGDQPDGRCRDGTRRYAGRIM